MDPTAKGNQSRISLALLLFVFAWDTLVICTTHACTHGSLKGFQTPSYPTRILLLQYANDITLFIEGSVEETRNLATLGGSICQLLQCSRALGTD